MKHSSGGGKRKNVHHRHYVNNEENNNNNKNLKVPYMTKIKNGMHIVIVLIQHPQYQLQQAMV
eukprot:13529892-Ditylum_brightwellii.AAC.1